jgi:hypothetical protein
VAAEFAEHPHDLAQGERLRGRRQCPSHAQEFARADLCDKRPDRRLLKTAEQLAKSPSSPINAACGNWASTQAAYRLFNNPKASPSGILKPHREATAQRMAGCGGPVLVMQDTVFFSYGAHVKTRGCIWNRANGNRRGLRGRFAIARDW